MTLGDDGLNISLLHMEFDLAFASFDAGLAFSAATALLPFGAEKLCLSWRQCNTEFTPTQGLNRESDNFVRISYLASLKHVVTINENRECDLAPSSA